MNENNSLLIKGEEKFVIIYNYVKCPVDLSLRYHEHEEEKNENTLTKIKELVKKGNKIKNETEAPFIRSYRKYGPGIKVFYVDFETPTDITTIRFRNYYSASICIYAKREPIQTPFDKKPFEKLINKIVLMEYPHDETNSQDIISIDACLGISSWNGIHRLLFVLKQPTFKWEHFDITELTILNTNLVKDLKSIDWHPKKTIFNLKEIEFEIPEYLFKGSVYSK